MKSLKIKEENSSPLGVLALHLNPHDPGRAHAIIGGGDDPRQGGAALASPVPSPSPIILNSPRGPASGQTVGALRICFVCDLYLPHLARGMCKKCYSRWLKAKHRGTCPQCGRENAPIWKGRCESCYTRERPLVKRACPACGKIKLIRGRNKLCNPCYEHARKRERANGRVARFPHELAKALRNAANSRGLTTTQLVIEIAENYLVDHKTNPAEQTVADKGAWKENV